jgi:hypothetical protein
MGLSFRQLEEVVAKFDDGALLISSSSDSPDLGIKTKTNYVIIKSLYPEVFSIVKNKEKKT